MHWESLHEGGGNGARACVCVCEGMKNRGGCAAARFVAREFLSVGADSTLVYIRALFAGARRSFELIKLPECGPALFFCINADGFYFFFL